MQYTYSGHVHGGWAPHANSSYSVGGAPQSLGQPTYAGRPSIYGQPSGMAFNSHRSSQSPATGGEGLPPPPYDQVHQPFQTPISGGGPGSAQQPPTPSSASGHVDAYTHTRPPSTPSYYTPSSTPQQQSFPAYTTQPSPTHASPTTSGPGPRGLSSISSQSSAMAPPAPYRPYQSYSTLPTMAGPVMSNIHQPGAQMSMISGMGVPQGYASHPIMYGHPQAAPQNERPFKCDQCVQSFSRNHDLKRHKRIHLAVKPFPCSYCSKSFSRKDALKVWSSLLTKTCLFHKETLCCKC